MFPSSKSFSSSVYTQSYRQTSSPFWVLGDFSPGHEIVELLRPVVVLANHDGEMRKILLNGVRVALGNIQVITWRVFNAKHSLRVGMYN